MLVITHNLHFLEWTKLLPYHVRVFKFDREMSGIRKVFFYATLKPRLKVLTSMYDIVFCDWFSKMAKITSEVSSKPVFVRLHRGEVHNPIYLKTANLRNIKAIITVSKFYRKLVREVVGENIPIYVVPNGVDTKRFSYNPHIHTPLKICTVSNLVPRKRIFDLIVNNPDLEIDIGGVGVERRILEDAIERFNLKARLCGYVKLPEFYHQHDIFIMNSSDEGHSVALLEAMSCGLIPLCFAWHGVEEVLPEEHIYRSYEELREKLSEIRSMSESEIMSLKRKMRAIVESNFSLEKQVERFISIFRSEMD